jgi:hypothetical protein
VIVRAPVPPTALGVKVTEQVADAPDPASVHSRSLNWPGPFDPNPTVPVGVLALPAEASLTVAVHVVGAPAPTALGEQLTLVEDERLVTVTVSPGLSLSKWIASLK